MKLLGLGQTSDGKSKSSSMSLLSSIFVTNTYWGVSVGYRKSGEVEINSDVKEYTKDRSTKYYSKLCSLFFCSTNGTVGNPVFRCFFSHLTL